MTGKLFYGDNLDVLREHVAAESVDLVYLDPPFNSNANYNILFKSKTGDGADAQIEAFEDTWHWNDKAEDAFDQVMRSGNTDAAELLRAMRGFLGQNDMMAYLAMMAIRLIELHRVLKPTGSLYLHCDPTASHYLKLLLDGVFGADKFRNEVVWKRTTPKGLAFSRFASNHDVLLAFQKGDAAIWNSGYAPHSSDYLERYNLVDESTGRRFQATSLLNPSANRPNLTYEFGGHTRVWRWTRERMQEAADAGLIYFPPKGGVPREKRFLDEQEGVPLSDVWTDIPPINSQAQERLGYPTQKPLALLERIIAASSHEGDTVLDPFCGCGTAVHAAEKLGRDWLGIDVTHLAISLIEKRLRDAFPALAFTVEGRPTTLDGAQELATRDKFEFQKWVTTYIGGHPYRGGRKGADGGVDGHIYFNGWDGVAQKILPEKAIISVKGGAQRSVGMIAELVETIGRQGAAVGILIMAALPTREMEKRAAAAGVYDLGEHGRYPRVQILTLKEVMDGKRPRLPNVDRTMFRTARREETGKQERML